MLNNATSTLKKYLSSVSLVGIVTVASALERGESNAR